MTRVSVSELKANLSRYLRQVRRGGEVQVLDRGVPVARLTRVSSDEQPKDDDKRERLVRAGVLWAGKGDARAILDSRPLEVPTSILGALEQERADRV